MTSPENQDKIRKAEEVSKKKEEKQIEKQNLIKTLISEDKQKKSKEGHMQGRHCEVQKPSCDEKGWWEGWKG